jgi:hypothetical protein
MENIQIPGVPADVAHFESLSVLLDAVEATGENGVYRAIPRAREHDSIVLTNLDFYGPPLYRFVDMCRSGQGFERELHTISTMVDDLVAKLPPLPTIQRVRQHGAQGSTLRVHSVLRGDLQHAWTRTERLSRLSTRPIMTIIVDASFLADRGEQDLFWSAAATMARTQILEQAGRRVALIACEASHQAVGYHINRDLTRITTTILKDYSDPWNIQDVICTTNLAFFRRLCFRLREASPLGVQPGYGYTCPKPTKDRIYRTLADVYGWPELLRGADPNSDGVNSEMRAFLWIAQTLKALGAE